MSNSGSQIQTAVHVRLATAAALATCTYADASSVLPTSTLGAKLTASSNAALTVDGVTAAVDDEILVKDQVATLQNGVYRVRAAGSTTAPWKLERSKHAEFSEQFNGMLVTTGPDGSANASTTYLYSGVVAPVVGTDSLSYAAQGGAGTGYATTASVTALSADPQFFQPVTTNNIAPVATGSTIAIFVNPSGTIAALTLTLPTGAFKGQRMTLNSTQIVTTLTLAGAATDTKGLAQPTALIATSALEWNWDSVSAKWNRIR